MKRKSGFTLIEVMIVVVIIGIGAMMAGTNMKLWVNKANAGGFFREAFAETSLAKGMAMATRRQHVIRVDFTANTLKIMRGDASHGSSGGWSDVNVQLSGEFQVAERWRLSGEVVRAHLIGGAGRSPVLESRNQGTFALTLWYRLK